MEQCLLALDEDPGDDEAGRALFRAVHTIKGSAGVFGFSHIEDFTHDLENLLDLVRSGSVPVEPELVRLFLDCRDHIGVLLGLIDASGVVHAAGTETAARGTVLMQRVRERLPATKEDSSIEESAGKTADSAAHAAAETHWRLSLEFQPDVFRHGLDPLPFVRYLREIGTIRDVITHTDRVPTLEQLDPESCVLDFEILFTGAVTEAQLREAFEFVEHDCKIRIERVTEDAVKDEAAAPKSAGASRVPISGDSFSALAAAGHRESRSFRVDARKLDHLVNLVGELVISTAHLAQVADFDENSGAASITDQVLKLVGEIRDGAFGLRMVPIGGIFSRFRRAVHDLSAELQKSVRLETHGGDTELDRNIVERLTDPLMHIVRNAADHGLESPAERAQAGKDPEGRITLHAFGETGEIVIEVKDDGRGLDAAAIRRKAESQGLVAPEQELTREEVLRLIFHPGMSTAANVTNISGRGVGMDVVLRNIEALRGRVELDSEPGKGTTVRIILPLTLAIIDGFLVRAGESHFVIPLDMVMECVEFEEAGTAARGVVNLREEVLPFVRLTSFFELTPPPPGARTSLVVVRHGARRAGLVVEDLLGEFQSVIKSLGPLFENVRGLSGSTILGNGAIALVLDVPTLLDLLENEDASSMRGGVDLYSVREGLLRELEAPDDSTRGD